MKKYILVITAVISLPFFSQEENELLLRNKNIEESENKLETIENIIEKIFVLPSRKVGVDKNKKEYDWQKLPHQRSEIQNETVSIQNCTGRKVNRSFKLECPKQSANQGTIQ